MRSDILLNLGPDGAECMVGRRFGIQALKANLVTEVVILVESEAEAL